jgi:hypothetical protein
MPFSAFLPSPKVSAFSTEHPPDSASRSGLLVTISTPIRTGKSFTTDFETERIPEEFRLVRGRRYVLSSSAASD